MGRNIICKPDVTINAEQQLYVIATGTGFSCLGFDVLLTRATKLHAWLKSELIEPPTEVDEYDRGTMLAYARYDDLMDAAHRHCIDTATRCSTELSPQLIGKEGARVEVVDRYGQTRRFWVGKSTGWLPCHLEISRRNSRGGPAVMGEPFQSVRIVGC